MKHNIPSSRLLYLLYTGCVVKNTRSFKIIIILLYFNKICNTKIKFAPQHSHLILLKRLDVSARARAAPHKLDPFFLYIDYKTPCFEVYFSRKRSLGHHDIYLSYCNLACRRQTLFTSLFWSNNVQKVDR